jgi:hypothetical protein
VWITKRRLRAAYPARRPLKGASPSFSLLAECDAGTRINKYFPKSPTVALHDEREIEKALGTAPFASPAGRGIKSKSP